MASLTKRVAKKLRAELESGESVQVALLVETPGTYGGAGVGVVLAPGVMRQRLEEATRDDRASEAGTASEFPVGSCALVVTDRRTLVVLSNGLIIGRTVLEIPPGGVLVGSVRHRLLARQVELLFADGTMVVVDVQRAQPFKEFLAALGRMST